jgi:hypothetical protein
VSPWGLARYWRSAKSEKGDATDGREAHPDA